MLRIFDFYSHIFGYQYFSLFTRNHSVIIFSYNYVKKSSLENVKFYFEINSDLAKIRIHATYHSKAQNPNFLLPKYWPPKSLLFVHINFWAWCVYYTYWKEKIYFKTFSSCHLVPWWYPKFFDRKLWYSILTFNWRVVSTFSTHE